MRAKHINAMRMGAFVLAALPFGGVRAENYASDAAARQWSVPLCAKAVESPDGAAKDDAEHRYCPDLREPTTAQFEIQLGDTLLHQYGDRRLALLQYNNAAQKGSPDAAGRVAALNSLASTPSRVASPRDQDESASSSEALNMPSACVKAQNEGDHDFASACGIALLVCGSKFAVASGKPAYGHLVNKCIENAVARVTKARSP